MATPGQLKALAGAGTGVMPEIQQRAAGTCDGGPGAIIGSQQLNTQHRDWPPVHLSLGQHTREQSRTP
jgi:hypothetical protein